MSDSKSISVNLTARQGLITLLLMVSLVFAGDYLRSFWAGTPADVGKNIDMQTLVLSLKIDALTARVDSIARMAITNRDEFTGFEKRMMDRIDERQNDIQETVRLVGRNLENRIAPLANKVDTLTENR